MLISLSRKDKMSVLMIFIILGTCTFYYYGNEMQKELNIIKLSQEKCEADLQTAKYQLVVVSEYKHKIDKLLSDTKKAYDTDKEKFSDVLDSCMAMKQQTIMCQSQFDDLMTECKNVREKLSKVMQDLPKYTRG